MEKVKGSEYFPKTLYVAIKIQGDSSGNQDQGMERDDLEGVLDFSFFMKQRWVADKEKINFIINL